jgi:hypothetical protein
LILVSYTAGGDVATASCRDGFWTELQRKRVPMKSGDLLGARLQTNGCLEVYVGGALAYAVDASAFTSTLPEPSHLGVWASVPAGGSVQWDDFGGGTGGP